MGKNKKEEIDSNNKNENKQLVVGIHACVHNYTLHFMYFEGGYTLDIEVAFLIQASNLTGSLIHSGLESSAFGHMTIAALLSPLKAQHTAHTSLCLCIVIMLYFVHQSLTTP